MKIEAGKTYNTRDGKTIKMLSGNHLNYPFSGPGGYESWKADGRFTSSLDEHPLDIISEVAAAPEAPVPNVVTWHSVHTDGSVGTGWHIKGNAAKATKAPAILRIEIDHTNPASPVLVSATLEKP